MTLGYRLRLFDAKFNIVQRRRFKPLQWCKLFDAQALVALFPFFTVTCYTNAPSVRTGVFNVMVQPGPVVAGWP